MISNKAAAILLFITLNMQCAAASSSEGAQGPSLSGKSVFRARKQNSASNAKKNVLRDMDNVVVPVGAQGEGVKEMEILRGRAPNTKKATPAVKDAINTTSDVLPRSNQIVTRVSICRRLFSWTAASITKKVKLLIEEGKYWAAMCLAITMSRDDFLGLTCSIVKTFEQYKGLVYYLKFRNLVASFYARGDIRVVREAIITESSAYGKESYLYDGDLEMALPLALEEGRHDRFIELLDIRKGITAVMDGRYRRGAITSFVRFVFDFIRFLAPWKDGTALRRFFILRGDALKDKHRDMFDALCQMLMRHLGSRLVLPKAEKLLIDLIGQPLLLTPEVFARGFLYHDSEEYRLAFIKHGWREAIEEGLKTEYTNGGKELWRVMQAEKPNQFSGQFPETEEERTAACMHIPTKQEREERWADKNAEILYAMIKRESISSIFPDVLWYIISGYAVLLNDNDDLTPSIE